MAKLNNRGAPVKKSFPFFKTIIVLGLLGLGGWSFLHQQDIMDEFHHLIHGDVARDDAPPPSVAVPAPAPVVAAPVPNSADPCSYYPAGSNEYLVCTDRMQKIEATKKLQEQRDKAYLLPPPAAPAPAPAPATGAATGPGGRPQPEPFSGAVPATQ